MKLREIIVKWLFPNLKQETVEHIVKKPSGIKVFIPKEKTREDILNEEEGQNNELPEPIK